MNNVSEFEETAKRFLPPKSKERYEFIYKIFKDWCQNNGISNISESALLAHFTELAKVRKPSTLNTTYSILNRTLMLADKFDMSKCNKLKAFLQTQNTGFKPKKSSVFSRENIEEFLRNAPMDLLPEKVGVSYNLWL